MEAYITIKQFVDLDVIRKNIKSIKALTQKKVIFMVKADAYSHGAEAVAKATEGVADMFGVATVDEGVVLRNFGIKLPILVAVVEESKIDFAIKYGLTIAVQNCAQLATIITHSNALKIKPKLHIKLDTGMHRLGAEADEIACIIRLSKESDIEIEGVYSHLRSLNEAQVASFLSMSQKICEAYPKAMRHLASSSALCREDLHFDAVRVGLSGYFGAMTVVSEVLATRYIAGGEYVSYGDFKLTNSAKVAVVFGGYADGIPRENPSAVYIRGKACEVLGRVCMDMFIVKTDDFFAEIGEKVVIVGGENNISDVAKQRNTIEYTVLTSFSGRTERIYFDDKNGNEKICSGEVAEDK
ncbi:MAG: alanine racemase [Clostridia bacterium]